MTQLEIASRFRGPAQSGNGGYTCGCVAEALAGGVEVTLRAPPPLDTALALEPAADGGGRLWHGERLIAEASPVQFQLELPEPVSWADARRAEADFVGLRNHPYPSCFVCGTERARGDGLRLFTGPVAGRRLVAAAWQVPEALCDGAGVLPARYVWSSLDCPSWFGYATFAEQVPPILLGRLAAKVARAPGAGERCVVVGWSQGREGRRILCGSALFSAQGECLAHARATWVVLKSE